MYNPFEINKKAEFKDAVTEQAYLNHEIRGSIQYLKMILLLFGVIYMLLAAYDYFYVTDTALFMKTLVLRLAVLVFAVVLFFTIDRLDNTKLALLYITFFEVVALLSYYVILYMLSTQGFLEQCMAVIVLLLAIFLIPNQWFNLMLLSCIGTLIYLVITLPHIEQMSVYSYFEAAIYLALVNVFSGISSYRIQYYKRRQYANQQQLELLTVTDKLTGVYNRVKFDNVLEEWCSLGNRYHMPFSVIMYDLDDYKVVNDTYGHVEGDKVLISCCGEIQKSIRSGDIYARWGGEEFMLLLPYTAINPAYDLAERLRRRIAENAFCSCHPITCSFGVVEFRDGDNPETLIKRVDNLMYIAKKTGKNKVVKE